MKIPQYDPKTKDPELIDMLTDMRNLLNNGRYVIPVATSVPSNAGDEGQEVLVSNGNKVDRYTYVNGVWRGTGLGWEYGFGYITISGTPAYQAASLTFDRVYTTAPIVLVTYIGVKTGTAPTTASDFSGANTLRIFASYAPSTTGCTVVVYTGNASALTNGQHEGFAYLVIPVS